MLFILISLLIVLRWNDCGAYNYCGTNTPCDLKKKTHFVCDMEKELSPYQDTTKFILLIPETLQVRNLFLDKHNEVRNRLARGNLTAENGKTFKSAKRMREVIWDEELAYLARVHAGLVADAHSQCHATKRFPHAGQNLGFLSYSKKVGIKHIVNSTISAFFNEYLTTEDPDALIEKNNGMGKQGHFTVVVSDRVSRIGCAVAAGNHCNKMGDEYTCFFTTCHYDFSNLIGSYVFLEGTAVSKCNDWQSKPSIRYENLCSNTGQIFDDNGKLVS